MLVVHVSGFSLDEKGISKRSTMFRFLFQASLHYFVYPLYT